MRYIFGTCAIIVIGLSRYSTTKKAPHLTAVGGELWFPFGKSAKSMG
ncbi:MAG: hypothetical protein RMN24_09310 [Anaerolineae bacterium]|nr:hypothetical protein [Caldilineales bacterium]MDW8269351.1 hypothetical protein [Anaerolineae bacterium]